MLKSFIVSAYLAYTACALPSQHVKRQSIPTINGFPNPDAQQIVAIAKAAHGTLPNTPMPAAGSIDNATLTNFQVIAFNELFETAFFNSFLYNVTNNVTGYCIDDPKYRKYIIKSLTAIVAQEQTHALAANSILKSQGMAPIQPCPNYIFPMSDCFESAVLLAQTFTDVVLGTLQSVQKVAGNAGEGSLVQTISSIVSQEGEQVGGFRFIQSKIPSAQPFLTNSPGAYAWSALHMFFVPGTCPSATAINVPYFAPLTIVTKPTPKSTEITGSFDLSKLAMAKPVTPVSWTTSTNFTSVASLVYLSGQNVPLVVPIKSYSVSGTAVQFTADFPFAANDLYGLTLASVVNGQGPFSTTDAVVANSVFAPGLIEVQ